MKVKVNPVSGALGTPCIVSAAVALRLSPNPRTYRLAQDVLSIVTITTATYRALTRRKSALRWAMSYVFERLRYKELPERMKPRPRLAIAFTPY
jgi:hypothetical protein